MKYKLYKEGEKAEKMVTVRLVPTDYGSIRLIAVNDAGEVLSSGSLLDLHPDGRIHRHDCVGKELGFDLDHDGRIKVSN